MNENVIFNNGEVSLHGTLSRPDNAGPYPVVVVAHTSNAGTRDFGVYQHLTRTLPPGGVAVFVFDRRGSGSSTGDFEIATFHDLATDMRAAIDHLKLRNDIDPKRIGLWGMSQGAWIAPLTASISTDVSFLIAVSAVGVSPAEQMSFSAECELREEEYSEEAIMNMLELRGLIDKYYRGRATRIEVRKKLDAFQNEAWFSLSYLGEELPEDPIATQWHQIMDFDPIPMMQDIDIPVLLLYGEYDPWVPIRKSVARWKKYGPTDVTIHHIKDANHFMKSIALSGIRADEGPQVEEYSTILRQWVKQQLQQSR